MSCLFAIMIPTELMTFIAHAPTSDTAADDFFSPSIFNSFSLYLPQLPATQYSTTTLTSPGLQIYNYGRRKCWTDPPLATKKRESGNNELPDKYLTSNMLNCAAQINGIESFTNETTGGELCRSGNSETEYFSVTALIISSPSRIGVNAVIGREI